MIDLNSDIEPSRGWLLCSATGINDEGQIVGWGIHDGKRRVYRLSPPAQPKIPDKKIFPERL